MSNQVAHVLHWSAAAADAGRGGHVAEVAADVAEQMVAADGGDEQVGVAVVVVVADGDAHAVEVDRQARPPRSRR